jgi:hypothetical protein
MKYLGVQNGHGALPRGPEAGFISNAPGLGVRFGQSYACAAIEPGQLASGWSAFHPCDAICPDLTTVVALGSSAGVGLPPEVTQGGRFAYAMVQHIAQAQLGAAAFRQP